MSFIRPDEFIILFHTGSLTMDDLKRVSDAGVKTAVFPILWEEIEQKSGEYDWDQLDAEVERLKEAGISHSCVAMRTRLTGSPMIGICNPQMARCGATTSDTEAVTVSPCYRPGAKMLWNASVLSCGLATTATMTNGRRCMPEVHTPARCCCLE